MPPTVKRATRGISPILLVLAALCFLLPFIGVSCNSAAAGGAAGALGQLGGSSGSSSPAQQQCLTAISNGSDFVTYSGVNLITGSDPSTSAPGCDTASSTSSSDKGGVGAQPLLIAALALIVIGILATALRAPLRAVVAGGAALAAAGLVIVNNSTIHTVILNKLNSSGNTSTFGSADAFFSVHAAIGFTLILVALFLALLVNIVAAMPGRTAATATAEAGAWPAPATPPPQGGAPPPYTPPPTALPGSPGSPPPPSAPPPPA